MPLYQIIAVIASQLQGIRNRKKNVGIVVEQFSLEYVARHGFILYYNIVLAFTFWQQNVKGLHTNDKEVLNVSDIDNYDCKCECQIEQMLQLIDSTVWFIAWYVFI